MRHLLSIAGRNVVRQRGRTLLLGGAIAAVTLLLVLLSGLSEGVRATMVRAATTLLNAHVNVGGFYKVTGGVVAPFVTDSRPLVELVRRETPQARLVVERLFGFARIIGPRSSFHVTIRGVEVDREELDRVLQITRGDLKALREPGTALIFEKQARKLGVTVGDTLTVSAATLRGVNNALDVRVAAIARDLGSLSLFVVVVPNSTIRELYGLKPDVTGFIQIYLHDITEAPAVAARLAQKIAAAGHRVLESRGESFSEKLYDRVINEGWTGQKIDVTTWDEHVAALAWVITAFDLLTWVLIGVLLTIVAVGLVNALWLAIRERTREIGTLRAIGVSRGGILALFMLEAGLLALVASGIGAAAGAGLAAVLDAAGIPVSEGAAVFLMSDTLSFSVSAASVLLSIGVITGVMTLFSFLPAYRAARLPPVTAIQRVG